MTNGDDQESASVAVVARLTLSAPTTKALPYLRVSIIIFVILPRDANIKRGFSRHAVFVCPSVCPSVTFVDCIKTNKYLFKIVSPSGRSTILAFPYRTYGSILMGTFLTGASNADWVGRNRDSEPKSGFTACCEPFQRQMQLSATDHCEFITLVAGKRPNLLIAGNNDEVYDKKPQRYAEDNVTQWLI